MVLVRLATMLGGSAGLASAQAGKSDASPVEGIVGAVVALSGTGLGKKQGEVLLGD